MSVDTLAVAEFEAIVTASFDRIGSHAVTVALDNNVHSRGPASATTTSRSPLSFLRKVKSHATSLLFSHTRQQVSPSFVSLPPRPATPVPFPKSKPLPRTFLTRALTKSPHTPDLHKRSFFDDDDDNIVVDRRPQTRPSRRIASAPARPDSRLSSIFTAPPFSPSIAEQHGIRSADSRAGPARTHRPSLGLKLLTKFTSPKLASPHSSLLTDLSPITPSYPSHPYPTAFPGCGRTHPYGVFPEDRSITPEQDPFRKDEVSPTLLAIPRLPNSSPRSGSLYDDSHATKQISTSRSVPALSSRWSFDTESLPSSPVHAPVGRPHPAPSPGRNVLPASPFLGPSTSLTFPLPPSVPESLPLPGVTVRVITPTPGPPPAYPPPPTPPPFGPLPCPPPAGEVVASRTRPSGRLPKESSRRSRRDSTKLIPRSTPTGQVQRRRSRLRVDKSSPPFAPRPMPAPPCLEERSLDSAQWTHEKRAPRRRDRPSSPFPLPLLPIRARQDPTGRLEALKAAARFADPWKDSIFHQFDQSADAIPDSEVEPDRDFDSDKARKKVSVSSATSAQSAVSSISTTFTSTTTSSTSIVTTLTIDSPLTCPCISADKPNHVSQVHITDEDGSAVGAAMYNTPSSWLAKASPSSVKPPARSPGIYVKQGGTLTMHGDQSDLFLADGEHAIIGTSGWIEFRSYCDARGDVSLCLAGSPHGNGVADVLVFEIQHAGKTCGVELMLIPRTPSADFPGRIPGSYPLSPSDLPSLLPAVPHTSSADVPQSPWIKWCGSVLGLEGVPPPREASCIRPLSPSLAGLKIGNHLDSGTQRNAVLAFVTTLPTTLRDLAERAGEMNLLDGIVTP
ncbi:hypothetical protein BJV78DRAFT_1239805 [Lactifluus subvellereus]|nr:hypothetical protein BJV78DRAFT_1239805 [Lactifluus subvellereus]